MQQGARFSQSNTPGVCLTLPLTSFWPRSRGTSLHDFSRNIVAIGKPHERKRPSFASAGGLYVESRPCRGADCRTSSGHSVCVLRGAPMHCARMCLCGRDVMLVWRVCHGSSAWGMSKLLLPEASPGSRSDHASTACRSIRLTASVRPPFRTSYRRDLPLEMYLFMYSTSSVRGCPDGPRVWNASPVRTYPRIAVVTEMLMLFALKSPGFEGHSQDTARTSRTSKTQKNLRPEEAAALYRAPHHGTSALRWLAFLSYQRETHIPVALSSTWLDGKYLTL